MDVAPRPNELVQSQYAAPMLTHTGTHEDKRGVPGREGRSGKQQAECTGRCDIQLQSRPRPSSAVRHRGVDARGHRRCRSPDCRRGLATQRWRTPAYAPRAACKFNERGRGLRMLPVQTYPECEWSLDRYHDWPSGSHIASADGEWSI